MCETTTTIIKEWKWRCASSVPVRQSAASAAHNSTLIDRAPFPLSLLTHSFTHYYFFFYYCCCLNLPAIAVATAATTANASFGLNCAAIRHQQQQKCRSTKRTVGGGEIGEMTTAAQVVLPELLKRSSLMFSEKWERRRCAPRKERKRKKKKKKITTNFQSPKLLSATAHTSVGHSLKNGG